MSTELRSSEGDDDLVKMSCSRNKCTPSVMQESEFRILLISVSCLLFILGKVPVVGQGFCINRFLKVAHMLGP